TLPRDGLRPNRLQQEDGMRIEPPPSLAWAIGNAPAATRDADPPLEPPGVLARSKGFLVGPCSSGSVTGSNPSSGAWVVDTKSKPAARYREMSVLSCAATCPWKKRLPPSIGTPAIGARRFLVANGTPRNGPSVRAAAAPRRAASKRRSTTAFKRGLTRSIRAIASSTSSGALTRRRRPSSPTPTASQEPYSAIPMRLGTVAARRAWTDLPVGAAPPAQLRSPMTRRGNATCIAGLPAADQVRTPNAHDHRDRRSPCHECR